MIVTSKKRNNVTSPPIARRNSGVTASRRQQRPTTITASRGLTANAVRRAPGRGVTASNKIVLSPDKQRFASQLSRNMRSQSRITAATNTSNIMARPDFLELLPLFVQKLLVLDVYGSVAMNSRTQMIPYFKVIAENSKGVTQAGDILSSPFVNRQGLDPDFAGRAVRNEILDVTAATQQLAYGPVLPGTVTLSVTKSDGSQSSIIDTIEDGGQLFASTDDKRQTALGTIDYSTGTVTITSKTGISEIRATYQYDNETVGHNQEEYGAQMGKMYLQLDEFNLIAEAHELACYWSIFSAFAAQTEYGGNLGDMAKEAAFAEITAEINTKAFMKLKQAASYQPQFNWSAAPVQQGSVVPSDYMNTFKLKLGQAGASIYQRTRLSNPNRMVVGTQVAEYMKFCQGINVEANDENVGPYKLGSLDAFDIFVCPDYDPNEWVMACKSNDIRRNSALFGEYMPLTDTTPITLANNSSQQGYATMYAMDVVNPDTVVSGKITGTY